MTSWQLRRQWLDVAGKEQLFCSLFGHVFLAGDDGVWLLDPTDGSFERRWSSPSELIESLSVEANRDQFLLARIANAAGRRGVPLDHRQIWAFVPPPIVGGAFEVENLMALDLQIGLHDAGQLHGQLRDMAPGTEISGFEFRED